MNRKRMAKKCLKMFGHKIPVKWFSDYAIEYDPNDTDTPICLYVQRDDTIFNTLLLDINKAQHEFFNSLNLPISYDLFAILHEIGHLEAEQTDYDEYEIDLEILEKMYKMGIIDAKQYISIYNSLENEKNADEWAINWIKNNENTAKMLDSLMS